MADDGRPAKVPAEDGPALTADGLAVDLSDGNALHFSHAKELAEGHDVAEHAKEEVRQHRAEYKANKARVAEERLMTGEACGVDPAGVVHGNIHEPTAEEKHAHADHMKLYHNKQVAHNAAHPGSELGVMSVDEEGHTHENPRPTMSRQVSIDEEGIVHADAAPDEQVIDVEKEAHDHHIDRMKVFHRKKASRASEHSMTVDTEGHIDNDAHPSTMGFGGQASIDTDGVVHSPDANHHQADRLKLFHKKKMTRSGTSGEEIAPGSVITADDEGHIQGLSKADQPEPVITPTNASAC